MSDFTFLTAEQCFGDKQLEIFKKRGNKSVITDFAWLNCADFDEIDDDEIDDDEIDDDEIDDDEIIETTGHYWTKSYRDGSKVYMVRGNGNIASKYIRERDVGVRPALPISSIKEVPSNGEGVKRAEDGVLEVEYGYYPQKAVSRDMQERLEIAYTSGILSETRNIYTTDIDGVNETDESFKPQLHQEYEYIGKRYVRVKAKPFYDYYILHGERYLEGENVWIEVLPVKWLVDEKEKLMITDRIILAGIQFDYDRSYDEKDFDKTDIKKFMDKYLSKELFQVKGRDEYMSLKEGAENRNTNPYNLDFEEASEEDIIREAIRSNVSVFLHGKPGCGKSDRVKQLDPDFIELNLSHLDPELLDGLAGEKDGKAVHIKPPWLEELEAKCEEEADKIHILFLEELTNASPMIQAKAYGIALDKKVAGRWKLPENARVVAAGNELEDSLVANEMAEPLYDRFAHVNIETTVDSWLEWAATPDSTYERMDYEAEDRSRPKIHPAIYGYISYRGEEVLRTPYNSEKPEPHADPRRWKMASDMLYASNKPETLRAIVGEDITRDFISFCQIPTITVEDVIKGNYTKEDLDMDIGEKLATISGLVGVDSANMPEIRKFVKKLGPEMCKKFEVQWTHGDEERLERLQEVLLEEQEEKEQEEKKHEKGEIADMAEDGAKAYGEVNEKYQEYLARENAKENDIIDK